MLFGAFKRVAKDAVDVFQIEGFCKFFQIEEKLKREAFSVFWLRRYGRYGFVQVLWYYMLSPAEVLLMLKRTYNYLLGDPDLGIISFFAFGWKVGNSVKKQ